MTLNGAMAVTLRYFTEFGKPVLQKMICGGIYASLLYFLVRVKCRCEESLRSLSHLLMSFLSISNSSDKTSATLNSKNVYRMLLLVGQSC